MSTAKTATPFDGAKIWTRYRKLHDKIESAKSIGKLDRLSDDAYDLNLDIADAMGDAELAADLKYLLDDLRTAQMAYLEPTPGRQERTDFVSELDEATKRSGAFARVCEPLLAAGNDDPWVVRNLYVGLIASVAGADSARDQVRKQLEAGHLQPSDTIDAVLARADDALPAAQAVVGRLPESARSAAGV